MRIMNLTELTEKYIANNPSIKDCLKFGIINYSALSRKIMTESQINKRIKLDAILIAARRYRQKLKDYEIRNNKIMKILRNSKLDIQNKIIVAIIEKNIYFDNLIDLEKKIKKDSEVFHIIEGTDTITLVTREEYLEDIKNLFGSKIVKVNTNLAKIVIKSSREIEKTSGVIYYLISLFSENNINIVETMSCWTDTIFVIDEADVGKIMPILRF